MSKLEQIIKLKENHDYDSEKLNKIADKMEEKLGSAEMWNILRPGFSYDELIENLEYIARESGI